MKIKEGFRAFIRGLSIIFGKPEEGEGDRKLARMCNIVMGQIPAYGKHNVRKQLINSVEKDLRRAARKGEDKVNKMVENALSTPEYVTLIRKLDLHEYDIRALAIKAMRDISRTHKA